MAGERVYTCPHCEKEFKREGFPGAGGVECPWCQMSFAPGRSYLVEDEPSAPESKTAGSGLARWFALVAVGLAVVATGATFLARHGGRPKEEAQERVPEPAAVCEPQSVERSVAETVETLPRGRMLDRVRGRIGETPRQCDSRYGTPTDSGRLYGGGQQRDYRKGGFAITVSFMHDAKGALRASEIAYETASGREIGVYQVQELLAANQGEGLWRESSGDFWVNDAMATTAHLYQDKRLTIVSDELHRERKARSVEGMEGL